MDITRVMSREELEAQQEHLEAIESIRAILAHTYGRTFFKYLFKNFSVGELPERGLTGEHLADVLGFLRAGQSIFKIVAEVDPAQAGLLLGQIEREKYEKIIRDLNE